MTILSYSRVNIIYSEPAFKLLLQVLVPPKNSFHKSLVNYCGLDFELFIFNRFEKKYLQN